MKRLIVAIALTASAFSAYADTWRTPNNNGGYIVLTQRDCPQVPNMGWRAGYSYSSGGNTLSFCWMIIDNLVQAVYTDGSRYTYQPANFEKVPAGRQG